MAVNRSLHEASDPEAPVGAATPIPQLPASRVACRRCGQVHPGGRFVAGCPGPRLDSGLYSALLRRGELPSQAEAIAALAERQGEIEADLGGPENLSRIHRDAVRDLLRLELVAEFLFERLLQAGPLTGKGRTRAATMTYLQVLDRVHRLRQMVGLERRAKSLNVAEQFAALHEEQER